ncbi:MAG: MBL fold metallo-hydrolase [Phycisphaerae bacterium]
MWTEHPSRGVGELDSPLGRNDIALWWLGQAGFALRFRDHYMLIDPYLSDSLAVKYAGTEFPHVRMMPPPIVPANVKNLDWCLCTHRHSDHMDPGTLPELARQNPRCRFVLPRAEGRHAVEIGVPATHRILLDDGDRFEPVADVSILAVASAHETLERDTDGLCRFLGYVIRLGRVTLYHSGDCVPYDGLAERLRVTGVQVALLPVNGRDECRRSGGIPGNFNLHEALRLRRQAGIRYLVVHHFGMFDFNTVDPQTLRSRIREMGLEDVCFVPEAGRAMRLSPQSVGAP